MEPIHFSLTLVLVVITCLVSIPAFSREQMKDDLIFYPPAIKRNQYYRFITHGFIHADVMHLAFNMIALYSFGEHLEEIMSFDCVFGSMGRTVFLLMYVSALIVASLPDYIKYRDSYHFKSLGASGAVSAVIFSQIIFFPQTPIALLIGPAIPGWIFGVLYLGISAYLDRRGGGNINHGAHFWGAAYGIVFTLVCCQLFASYFNVYDNFKEQLHASGSDFVLICDF